MEITMAAVFMLCLRKGPTGTPEALLGKKLNGRKSDCGLTVPAGRVKKNETTENAAVRELDEEAGIKLVSSHLDPFIVDGTEHWFLAKMTDEMPREEAEADNMGTPIWGPAQYYPVDQIKRSQVAPWHWKKLRKALAHTLHA